MDLKSWGWIGLFYVLLISSFGLYWILTLCLLLSIFLVGFFFYLYSKLGNVDEFEGRLYRNPLATDVFCEGGIFQFTSKLDKPKIIDKTDTRVTGCDEIDGSLQEILGYIIRDYILPWYNLISIDKEFPEVTVRRTAQTFAINIANRVKEIDWIPYMTIQLVDEAASHLRLFRQARSKMQLSAVPKTARGSPLKDLRSSPKKSGHRRNKSETDINWYHNKATDLRREQEKMLSSSKYHSGGKRKLMTLEDIFFDLELIMERNLLCRDGVCEDSNQEKGYISELVQILMYILLPDEDFQCKPIRFLLRDILCNVVILPLFAMVSDPDYINQMIVWLCLGDAPIPSEIFLTVLRITDNCDELKSTKELVLEEIQIMRSRDSGGESDITVKQQLSSLFYVVKLIDSRISTIDNLNARDARCNLEHIQLDNAKKIDLTLDQILKNNVALSYYLDYVTSQDKQIDLFFYLNIEGWKVSVEQQLSDIHINKIKGIAENVQSVYNTIRSTALSIFEQYLGEKSEHPVQVKPILIQSLYFKIRNLSEVPSDLWFDEVQKFIYDKMENHPGYLPAFKKSKAYIRLLRELDLIQQIPNEYDNISVNSDENLEITILETKSEDYPAFQIVTESENSDFLCTENFQKSGRHMRSFSDVDVAVFTEDESRVATPESSSSKVEMAISADEDSLKNSLRTDNYSLSVNIIETGIVCEKGKTFGIYAIKVSTQYDTGFLEEWHIYRRYSDFHDLHTKIKEKYPDLAKLAFPGKKTFHNMERTVLEKRMKMLGTYMNEVCHADTISCHIGLKELLMTFLEQGDYDRATGGPISTTINNLVNPIKSGMKSIKNMPEQLINTVDEVVGGITKVFHNKQPRPPESSKVGAGIDETDDNIPLRIFMLLMDEVFDFKSRNQWLRRRLVTLLRQFIRTMFGDIVNKKILDYVSMMTSAKSVAHYLYMFKESLWPNGIKYEKLQERDQHTKNRTRVAAKAALLCCLPDELKHIVGSETSRRGLMTVFELFQNPTLNRRLLYVLFEGILCTLFPEKDMNKIISTLHSKSRRYQNFSEKKEVG